VSMAAKPVLRSEAGRNDWALGDEVYILFLSSLWA
jgi:hypothetical protein